MMSHFSHTRTQSSQADGRQAVIDIGSNTVRLVVYGGSRRAPVVLHNEKVSARLGKGLEENGRLGAKPMAEALSALGRYAVILHDAGITDIQAVATAAVRDSANGVEFLKEVRKVGIEAELLSGEKEAVMSAMGIVSAFPAAKGVVADLGGGSLELTDVDARECSHGTSLPFGSLRLASMRTVGPPRFHASIKGGLIESGWTSGSGNTLYLAGGSFRALARVAISRMFSGIDDPHGLELPTELVQKLCRSVVRGSAIGVNTGVSASRAASLPNTAALLSALLKELKPENVVFSSWGLREGLLYTKLNLEQKNQDPFLAGVVNFVEGQGIKPSVGAIVSGWIIDALPGGHGRNESFRLATTMLALATASIEPNLRRDTARDWALRKRWIGVSFKERALLHATMLGNFGEFSVPPELAARVQQVELEAAISWGAAIRLCRRFTGLSLNALSSSSLQASQGVLRLEARGTASRLYTDLVEKDLRNLAERWKLEPQFASN